VRATIPEGPREGKGPPHACYFGPGGPLSLCIAPSSGPSSVGAVGYFPATFCTDKAYSGSRMRGVAFPIALPAQRTDWGTFSLLNAKSKPLVLDTGIGGALRRLVQGRSTPQVLPIRKT